MKNKEKHMTFRTLAGLAIGLFGAAVMISGCGPAMHSFAPDVKNTLFAPRFGFFIINYPTEHSDSSAGVLYARVRYDDVVFIQTDSGYSAHYQFSVNVFSDKELTNVIYSRIIDRKLTVPTYAMTNSTTAYDTVEDKLTLKPGKYFVVLKLYDYNTDHTSSREVEHTFRNFLGDPLTISDVLLYDEKDTTGLPIDVVKNREDSIDARFFVSMKDYPASFSMHILAKSIGSPTYIDTTLQLTQDKQVQRYRIPIQTVVLAPATYQFKVTVKKGDAETSSETTLQILRSNMPLTSAELDQELEPLIYITTATVIDSLKTGTFAERRARFLDFWLNRANGRKEQANAMRAEFYKRVDFANTHLAGGFRHGWQSDRGRIYILYGAPDQVETHDQGFTTPPYQVWYYYNLKLEFVFLDEFGTGNYRLIQENQID